MTQPPLEKLIRAYLEVDERMRGLPIYNSALKVSALNFRPHQDCWLGILISPWFINLALLPQNPAAWDSFQVGERKIWEFPGATLDFLVCDLDDFGKLQSCSLFSTVFAFNAQEEVEEGAKLLMHQILTGESPTEEKKVDRRALLRGKF